MSTKQGTDSLLLRLERPKQLQLREPRDSDDAPERTRVIRGPLYLSLCEVLRLCRLLLANHHDAEEVVQDVFLKAHQKQQNMDPTELMLWRPWLIRSASTPVVIGALVDQRARDT